MPTMAMPRITPVLFQCVTSNSDVIGPPLVVLYVLVTDKYLSAVLLKLCLVVVPSV